MKYKNKLSICMMVKNEEKYLEKSLESLKPLFDNLKTELIIVDTGSEDNTIEIAKRYTKKVYFHQWNNNFGDMRNKTIKYATGEWILILDGDEVFQDIQPLIKFLNSSSSRKYNTGSITIKSITTENNEDIYQAVDILRLFRNTNDFSYMGTIHEQPQFQNPVFFTNAEVLHYGYLSTDKELMEYKFKRNVELLEKELEKDPKNIYNWYQLAQSYGMYKNYKKSLETILKAYKLVQKEKDSYRSYIYVYNHLARSYYHNQKLEELEQVCLEALEIEENFIDFYYYLGVAQSNLNRDEEAIKNFKKYLKVFEKYKNSNDKEGLATVRCMAKGTLGLYEDVCLNLCVLYRRNKDNEAALKYVRKVTKDYMQKRKVPHLVELYIDLGRYEELKDEYNKVLNMEEEILHTFWISLETSIDKQEDEKKEKLIKLFSTGDCKYSLLNKIRIYTKEETDDRKQDLINDIKQLDFKSLPVFFADITYFLLINTQMNIGEILYNLREHSIQSYFQYLINKYQEELSDVIVDYLENNDANQSFNEIRFRKVLNKTLLVLDKINEEKYQQIWNDYIIDGIYYIQQIYNKNIIENENIYDVKDDEDAFFIYMLKAERAKTKDVALHVRYLRKALKVYPSMKKGIETIMKNLKQENEEASTIETVDEFEELKKNVKININTLLEVQKTMEAKSLIDEYLQIVPDDLEMLMLKSEIYLKLM